MSRRSKVAIIVVIQILFLFGMIGVKYYILRYGTQVLLRSAPVDPWDMFKGEYVRLNYEISRVKDPDIAIEKKDLRNKTFYVVLEKGENYWSAVSISPVRPALDSNQVCIKGRVVYYDYRDNQYNMAYGIETYYVEEGTGRQIELKDAIDVIIRVDRFGNAVIEKIL